MPKTPYEGSETQQLLTLIGQATYTTLIVWAAHIYVDGTININNCQVAINGKILSDALPWASQIAALKGTSTITRIELCIGGDQTSFANIQNLIAHYGTGSNNPLYANLALLKTTLGLDTINYDDESVYDSQSSTELASMCIDLGMRVSLCPYTEQDYWVSLTKTINQANPVTVDAVYLQCYDGGAGNDPSE